MVFFHSWSRTCIFEMGIGASPIGCSSAYQPELLKNLHNLTCIRAFPQTLQSSLTVIHPDNRARLFTDAFRNYIQFDVLCYPCYHFKYVFQATFFSTHPSCCDKPLIHPVNNPKRNQIFRLSIQTGCYLSIQEPTLEVPYSKSSDYIIPARFKNYYIHQNHLSHNNNPYAPHTTENRQVIYHLQDG